MPKLENAPSLKIDTPIFGTKPLPPHVIRERRIAWNLLKHLESHTVVPLRVFDGEEWVEAKSKKAVMEVLFNVDEAHVSFDQGWVNFVLGNDLDIVQDYSVGLEPIMLKFKPEDYA